METSERENEPPLQYCLKGERSWWAWLRRRSKVVEAEAWAEDEELPFGEEEEELVVLRKKEEDVYDEDEEYISNEEESPQPPSALLRRRLQESLRESPRIIRELDSEEYQDPVQEDYHELQEADEERPLGTIADRPCAAELLKDPPAWFENFQPDVESGTSEEDREERIPPRKHRQKNEKKTKEEAPMWSNFVMGDSSCSDASPLPKRAKHSTRSQQANTPLTSSKRPATEKEKSKTKKSGPPTPATRPRRKTVRVDSEEEGL